MDGAPAGRAIAKAVSMVIYRPVLWRRLLRGGRARWLLRVAVSIAIVTYILVDVDTEDLVRTLASVRLGPLAGALALYLAGQALSAYKWSLLGRSVGYARPVGEYMRFYFIGMFFNLFGPSTIGGDVVRALYLTQVGVQYGLARAAGVALPFSYCLVLHPVISVMTAVPLSVAGIGVREGGYLYFLGRINVDDSIAVTLGLLWFAVTVMAGLVGGALFLASGAALPRVYPRPAAPADASAAWRAAASSKQARMWSVWAASRTRSWLRASPRTRTSSGMMLVARPPSMRPMFAVVSASMRPSRMLAIASAATRIALTPRSGAMPACAALPRTTTSRWLAPGARVKARPTASLSKTRPRRARTRDRSRCFAPRRPTSSQMVNTTSSGGWRSARSRHTRTHSQTSATPDLSSPPRTVVPSVRMTSSSTIGLTPSPGATVSMCAQGRSAGPPAVPGRGALRWPVAPPGAAPAPSKLTSAPSPPSSRASRAAIRPSQREWLSIRTSSRKSDFKRAGWITSGGH